MSGDGDENPRAMGTGRDRVVCVVVDTGDPNGPPGPFDALGSRAIDLRRAAGAIDAMRIVIGESLIAGRALVLIVGAPDRPDHQDLIARVRDYAPNAVVRIHRDHALVRPDEGGGAGPPPPSPTGEPPKGSGAVLLDDAEIALLRAVWDESERQGDQARSGAGGRP